MTTIAFKKLLAEEYWTTKGKIKKLQAQQDEAKARLREGLTNEVTKLGRFELKLISSIVTSTLWDNMVKDGIDIDKYKLIKDVKRFDLRLVK